MAPAARACRRATSRTSVNPSIALPRPGGVCAGAEARGPRYQPWRLGYVWAGAGRGMLAARPGRAVQVTRYTLRRRRAAGHRGAGSMRRPARPGRCRHAQQPLCDGRLRRR